MEENTSEGATAAAAYFMSDLYSYTYATGDLEEWENLSADDCSFCNSVIDDVSEYLAAGEKDSGSTVAVTRTRGESLGSDSSIYSIWVDVEQGPSRRFSDTGELLFETDSGSYQLFLALEWSDGWIVRGVDVLEPDGSS